MSLEERTLVVKNIDSRVSRSVLLELFNQAGPVINVVLRPDFAFIEFEHKISVGYAMALMEDIHLFGNQLTLIPKIRDDRSYSSHSENLKYFQEVMRQKPDYFLQFMPKESDQMRESSHSSGGNRRSYEYNSNNWSQRRQSYPERNRYSHKRYSNDFQDLR